VENARLLPFYYLVVMFLAASAVADLVGAPDPGRLPAVRFRPLVAARLGAGARGGGGAGAGGPRPVGRARLRPSGARPGSGHCSRRARRRARRPPRARPERPESRAGLDRVGRGGGRRPGWSHAVHAPDPGLPSRPGSGWNYSGLPRRSRPTPSFREVITTMAKLPPRTGAVGGRRRPSTTTARRWPSSSSRTFTDGRIASMEGLCTSSRRPPTPYHFMVVSAPGQEPVQPGAGGCTTAPCPTSSSVWAQMAG